MSVIETVRLVLEEYEIGEPWKLARGAGFVLPILGRPPFRERNYVLLQEVLDKVTFKDTGGIEGVNVSNRSGSNVFVRKGTLLQSKGTQPRSPVSGVVLEPDAEVVKIPVNCIHASRGIRSGVNFYAGGLTPHSIYMALGNQGETWTGITSYSNSVRAKAGGSSALRSALGSLSSNDLAGISEAVEEMKGTVEDALSQIPGDHINQVGIAIFDLKGVAGVEVFDHPESWHKFSESITRSYEEILTKEIPDLYEIRMDRAESVLRNFLKKAYDAERKLVTSNSVSSIWALTAEGIDGELAEVEGREIHLVLSNNTDSGKRQTPQISVFSPLLYPTRERWQRTTYEAPVFTTATHSPEWYRRSGSADLLQKLDKKPLRFKELLNSMDISRGTLGSRIREAKYMGLIHRTIREENGRTVWSLTALGKEESKAVKSGCGVGQW